MKALIKSKPIILTLLVFSVFSFLSCDKKKSSTRPEDTTGTITDIDGNPYSIVRIGNQWWMAENLKVTHYRNGEVIPNVTDNNTWSNFATGACCSYDNDDNNVETYGRLYNWHAVNDSRGIAPEGWHVPSDEEWKVLAEYLGGKEVAGGKMKESGTEHWNEPNINATNESGFLALPGGCRKKDGIYHLFFSSAYFWSSTAFDESRAISRGLLSENSELGRNYYFSYKKNGFSIRCVKN